MTPFGLRVPSREVSRSVGGVGLICGTGIHIGTETSIASTGAVVGSSDPGVSTQPLGSSRRSREESSTLAPQPMGPEAPTTPPKHLHAEPEAATTTTTKDDQLCRARRSCHPGTSG
ncbi:unnamed protein product [Lampetra fluviatilis]